MRKLPVLGAWPVVEQLVSGDVYGLDGTATSSRTDALHARTADADRVVKSVCPYCAVGCGQEIFVQDGKITNIEGDPDSPISAGCLCPKGSATFQLVCGSHRMKTVLYRRPFAREWEPIPLDRAMQMVAERVKSTRDTHWEAKVKDDCVNRTMAIAHLGGATLDNEENYLLKKLYTALGVIQVENQARI